MPTDYIQKEGTVLPQKLCDHCGQYVERKCRNRRRCPNAGGAVTPVKIPAGFWWAVGTISIIIALGLYGLLG